LTISSSLRFFDGTSAVLGRLVLAVLAVVAVAAVVVMVVVEDDDDRVKVQSWR
jgi:hypothetical protein